MRARDAALATVLLAAAVRPAAAQPVVLQRYEAGDPLVVGGMSELLVDGRDYLWIGTFDGLARFDGERFTRYSRGHGLPSSHVFCLHEDAAGRLWVCTSGGLARLREEGGQPVFEAQPITGRTSPPGLLLFDTQGRPWWVGDDGLHQGEVQPDGSWSSRTVLAGAPIASPVTKWWKAGARDGEGRMYFGVADRLVEVRGEQVTVHDPPPAHRGQQLTGILAEGDGTLVVSHQRGLSVFAPHAPAAERWRPIPTDAQAVDFTGALVRDSEGALLAGMRVGLLRLSGDAGRGWRSTHSLSGDPAIALARARAGRVWVATGRGLATITSGIAHLVPPEFPMYGASRILIARDGTIYSSADGGIVEVTADPPALVPGSQRPPFDRTNRRLLQDRAGGWWIGTDAGLYVAPGPRLDLTRARRLGVEQGAPTAPVSYSSRGGGLFEDDDGALWVATQDRRLFRCQGPVARPRCAPAPAPPVGPEYTVDGLTRDRSGQLWALSFTSLFRRRGTDWERWDARVPLPRVLGSWHFDQRGWLWLGSAMEGVVVLDPARPAPLLRRYTEQQGLASDRIFCLVEGAEGRLYLGTLRGVDQLDPDTGRLRLVVGGVTVRTCAADSHGVLWLGTSRGVTRYDPAAAGRVPPPPSVYLSAARVGGEPLPLPERGVTTLPEVVLPPGRNNVQLEYTAPSADDPGGILYQHRLLGADTDWSAAARDRSVRFAQLAPGRYRFEVRALNAEGVAGPMAGLSFEVRAPLWRRAWFQALALGAALGLGLMARRLQQQRARAVQRVQRQIASDLHDEMGSGLGSIGILAGLAADPALADRERQGLARRIAETAAELGSALSDIVWFLRPGAARLDQLAAHLAEQAGRLFPGSGARFEARFPADWGPAALSLEASRNVYLIALEALHNAARHAQARSVVLEVAPADGGWRLAVSDDGAGLPAAALAEAEAGGSGHGLPSMRRRAEAIGAALAWRPRAGGGTVVELRFRARGRGAARLT
ncbi:MAG TPA: two-component regulator propeller domain-containing protein [Vicinamibacteria bacterium]